MDKEYCGWMTFNYSIFWVEKNNPIGWIWCLRVSMLERSLLPQRIHPYPQRESGCKYEHCAVADMHLKPWL